jgi:hypothetical protein
MVGVIRDRTISDRFSRLMVVSKRNSPQWGQSLQGQAGGVGGAPRRGGGGNAEVQPRCSCGLVLGVEVGPEVVSENKRATVLVASGLFDL